ncbi:MAG: hypothetical protein R3B74_03265 [Nitrospirales bacterium]
MKLGTDPSLKLRMTNQLKRVSDVGLSDISIFIEGWNIQLKVH